MAGIPGTDAFARVGGSGFTWFNFKGTVVGFAQAIGYTSPTPVAEPQPIQPLNYRRPAEIVVPRAIGPGTITVTMFELWNKPVWARLAGMEDAVDLADVFESIWRDPAADVQAHVVIDVPRKRGGGTREGKHFKTFHQVVLTDIRDDETIDITTMSMQKPVTFQYAWQSDTRIGGGSGPKYPNEISYTGNQT